MRKYSTAILIVFLVLVFDQALKLWIKLNMFLGQEYFIFGDWFVIHFTENEGMAFGLELSGEYGKLILTLFRIVAVFFIAIYLKGIINRDSPKGLIISLSLILAGALGNIIDSVFYGVIFSSSYQQVATLFPVEGGYGAWFHGKVVDMLYFPIIDGFYPDWVPFVGGKFYRFFQPVFNIADAAITAGVLMIILFQRSYFQEEDEENTADEPTTDEVVDTNESVYIPNEESTEDDTTDPPLQPAN